MARKKSQPPYSRRKSNTRKIRKRFLIVCEGHTEEKYFREFQVLGRETKTATISLKIENAKAVGITVVREAIKFKAKDGDYGDDEVWCVFDRDAKSENYNQQNFNTAIELAFNDQCNLAISNDAFELWLLLHYEYYTSDTHRSKINQKLTQRLGTKYEKNAEQIYKQLKDKESQAIKNARKLWLSYSQHNSKSEDLELSELIQRHNINPSTTVYQLVSKLNEVINAK